MGSLNSAGSHEPVERVVLAVALDMSFAVQVTFAQKQGPSRQVRGLCCLHHLDHVGESVIEARR